MKYPGFNTSNNPPECPEDISRFERPFRQALTLHRLAFPDPYIYLAPQWQDSFSVLQPMYSFDQGLPYLKFYHVFLERCRALSLPLNHAIAFWDALLARRQADSLNPEDTYILIAGALSNSGDAFSYAVTRRIPKNFVYPSEIRQHASKTHLPDETIQKLTDGQEAHLQAIRMNSDEFQQTINLFPDFCRTWDAHLTAAKAYQRWKISCTISYPTTNDFSQEQILPLARIFRQYISLLKSYSNSTRSHTKFDVSWKNFDERGEGSLPYTLQGLLDILHQNPLLMDIAPAYLAVAFRKNACKIYTSDPSRSLRHIYPSLSTLDTDVKPILQKNTPSNTAIPIKVYTILYRILCTYFKNIGISYQSELSDFVFQRNCPSIGQQDYCVTEMQLQQILSGIVLPLNKFDNCGWIHPLLKLCAQNLNTALDLYHHDVSFFNLPDVSASIMKETKAMRSLKPSLDFVQDYRKIVLDPPDGLGAETLGAAVQNHLADLMDNQLEKLPDILQRVMYPNSPQYLGAIEQHIHLYCMSRIKKDVYTEVMKSVYTYLFPEEFADGKPISELISYTHKDL